MSKQTTLCYLTKGDEVLFIVKGDTPKNQKNMNAGKYLGVGGHMEEGETPYECALREIYEETSIDEADIKDFSLRGICSFINSKCDDETMYVYLGEYIGDKNPCPGSCDEGVLTWVKKENIKNIPTWEGDKVIFEELLNPINTRVFELKLIYDGNKLVEAKKIF